MAVITLIDGDTWIGIYSDDMLIYENHSISPDHLLRLLNHTKVEYFGRFDASGDWLEAVGNFPRLLCDVQICYRGCDYDFYEYIKVAEETK